MHWPLLRRFAFSPTGRSQPPGSEASSQLLYDCDCPILGLTFFVAFKSLTFNLKLIGNWPTTPWNGILPRTQQTIWSDSDDDVTVTPHGLLPIKCRLNGKNWIARSADSSPISQISSSATSLQKCLPCSVSFTRSRESSIQPRSTNFKIEESGSA